MNRNKLSIDVIFLESKIIMSNSIISFVDLRRNPGTSGERSGLQIRSRSPSSLVWASSDSSLTGGDNDVQAGLDESVRNDSLPLNKMLCECLKILKEKILIESIDIRMILYHIPILIEPINK